MKGLKPQNKVGFAFGSYGWNDKIINHVEDVMSELKWTIPVPAFNVNYIPPVIKLRELKKILDLIVNAK